MDLRISKTQIISTCIVLTVIPILTILFYHGVPRLSATPCISSTFVNATATLSALQFVFHLNSQERKVFSQNGEDGILEALLDRIGAKSKYYVEFGTETCKECNTRILREKHFGWKGLLMDGNYQNGDINLNKEYITYTNIVDLFQKHHVPLKFDLLSVDTDFKDYWILRAILAANYRPRIIIAEINTFLGWERPLTVPKDSNQLYWDGSSQYYGYSVAAAWKLGREFGYSLLYCEQNGVNCFFIIDGKDGFGGGFRISDFLLPQHIFRPNKLPHTPDLLKRSYVEV